MSAADIRRIALLKKWDAEMAQKTMTNTDKECADFETKTDSDVLELMGLDAAGWAREFNTVAKRLRYSKMDEGWLIGWFANAIECGRRAGREAERAEAVTDAEPFAWWAETGTAGAGDECNKLFFMRELAVDHVRRHGGYVVTVYRGPPKPEQPDAEPVAYQWRWTEGHPTNTRWRLCFMGDLPREFGGYAHEIVALYTHPPKPGPSLDVEALRETIARIVDPHSFIPYVGDGSTNDVWDKADAFRKADCVIAALTKPEGE